MSAHMSGPWTAEHGDDGSFDIYCELAPDRPAVVVSRSQWPNHAEESRANARLIAAAPDLLAALEELSAALFESRSVFPDGDDETTRLYDARRAADAAIAKARGGSK